MDDREHDRASELLGQRTAFAQFGELALKSNDLDEILTEACRLVSGALGTELAKVMACQDEGTELIVRAGTGWRPGVVGAATVPTGRFSAAGHALHTGQPTISADVENEGRFEVPTFVREHGVKAMVNVIILGPDGKPPYGVLEVDSRVQRLFTEDDAEFLRGYANLISAAVIRFSATSALRIQAAEKERLLHELQHRVKNNLQVITSLVRLQASRARHPEAERELTAIGHRVDTLRFIYDQLHHVGGVDRVDLGSYLGALTSSLFEFQGERAAKIRLVSELESLTVSSEAAVPLGMATTEFVTNSFKYAFGEKGGTIGIQLERMAPEQARLTLWDDGVGLPEDSKTGMGMRLVAGFARQLHGTANWDSDGGTRLSLVFSISTGAHKAPADNSVPDT
jgi:two-component sensor histidine kinase